MWLAGNPITATRKLLLCSNIYFDSHQQYVHFGYLSVGINDLIWLTIITKY